MSATTTSSAHADGVKDINCPANSGTAQACGDAGLYWVTRWAPNARCDLTAKFIGGNASAVMVAFQSASGPEPDTGWSSWLHINDTFSKAYWQNDGTQLRVWRAQADRSAVVRLRVTGPCGIANT